MITATPAIGWQLPSFYCPLESGVHPKAAELEKRAIAWIDDFGLYADETERAWGIATHSTDFSCRIIPHGDEELILLFIQWNHWAFAVDDWHDNNSKNTVRTARVVDLGARIVCNLEIPGLNMLEASPFSRALNDLSVRTRVMTTPAQFKRITEGLRDWLFGANWIAANTERDTIPTLNDFMAIRPSVNGTRFSLAFSEIASRIELDMELQYSPKIQALIAAAGFIVSCDNDFFSYAKEEGNKVTGENIINVLAYHHSCSPKEALSMAVGFRDRTMTLFIKLRNQMIESADTELRRYLKILSYYISGCIHWESGAPRYASPRNRNLLPVAGASFDIAWRKTPSDANPDPLPIPAVAWWWEQLDK